jgi:Skp family chaperone for outer membrane proteins
VAVVDTNKAIDASKPGKQAASRIQTRYSQLDKKLQGLQKDAQAKAEELSKAAEGLTPEEFEKRRAALQREVDSIQAETTRAEAELKAAAEEAYGPLYDRAAGIATDHAKRYGYVMVLENSDEDKAVIFADAQMVFIDITKDVTEQLDSGKGASRPAAKPSQGRRAPRARRR